jgi:hypothetical protein
MNYFVTKSHLPTGGSAITEQPPNGRVGQLQVARDLEQHFGDP